MVFNNSQTTIEMEQISSIQTAIEDIIIDNTYPAKEISAMMERFFHWWAFGSHPFVPWGDEKGYFITDEISDKRWTLSDIFTYWLTNIENKSNT